MKLKTWDKVFVIMASVIVMSTMSLWIGFKLGTSSQSDLGAERRHSLRPPMLNMRALDLPELPLERWYKCDACPNGEHIIDTVPRKRMQVVFDTILADTITFRDSLTHPWRCGHCGTWVHPDTLDEGRKEEKCEN